VKCHCCHDNSPLYFSDTISDNRLPGFPKAIEVTEHEATWRECCPDVPVPKLVATHVRHVLDEISLYH